MSMLRPSTLPRRPPTFRREGLGWASSNRWAGQSRTTAIPSAPDRVRLHHPSYRMEPAIFHLIAVTRRASSLPQLSFKRTTMKISTVSLDSTSTRAAVPKWAPANLMPSTQRSKPHRWLAMNPARAHRNGGKDRLMQSSRN
jgi:hypothetical protein